MVDKDLLRNILYMNWLRPEGVAWEYVAASLLRKWLPNSNSKMDFGSGNGYTTFLASGGKFKDEYDWYYNVDIDGFYENKDIYNTHKLNEIYKYIENEANIKWSIAVDHKKALLEQAKQLNLYDKVLEHDGNKFLELENKYDFIFSNILYWLEKPMEVIANLQKLLEQNGVMVIVFPNSNFYKSAISYNWKAKQSELLRLLNRGRADSIMWAKDYKEFKNELENTFSSLKIEEFTTYLSPDLLKLWDVGLRPLSPALISHVNKITPEERLLFKNQWCDSLLQILTEQVKEEEANVGDSKNGFNFVVLRNLTT